MIQDRHPVRVDDRTSGLVIRALRRRRGWSQQYLAERARVSQATISRVERGWLEDITLRVIRVIFGALEARVQLAPRWKGAELERLLDQDHSTLVADVARRLSSMGWAVELEVTYSEWGERGSIDVLGLRPREGIAVVVEVKTAIASTEALGRKLDEKARLAPLIIGRRWGWTPTRVGRIVVLPDTSRLRRLVAQHLVITTMFPMRGIATRSWLQQPNGPIAGLWFLPNSRPTTQRRGSRPSGRPARGYSSVKPVPDTAPAAESGSIRHR